MNKKQIIDEMSKLFPRGFDSELMVNKVFEIILNSLKKGEKVVISGFGTFKVVEHMPALRRNPKTNEKVMVGPLKKIRFKPSKTIFNNESK
ncbi:MAG: HU family DNA-binding protein [Elusimicrobiales bacterium]|nr:HU family DNA-binding protein [Elusimicrobiales bacterium]HOL62162.1 HU family DNA-binding protein [Elusimicrobiales bacterium]HPO95531.1 HU family DNA-binding protein [Elusimicrobiales bacterium]